MNRYIHIKPTNGHKILLAALLLILLNGRGLTAHGQISNKGTLTVEENATSIMAVASVNTNSFVINRDTGINNPAPFN